MTANELYRFCLKELSFTDCGDFEASCIFDDILNISRNDLITKNIQVANQQVDLVKSLIHQRKKGRPLQYILGKWDFYDMSFFVGEGVLIPRPETEMLVDLALDSIKNIQNPIIFDLCAGSGCVGLTLAKHRPDSKVYLFEKEDKAFEYLNKNIEKYSLNNAIPIKCDIFSYGCSALPFADVLLSNPPYIRTEEIPSLQREVLNEPVSALDGGSAGLVFYRCIYDKWLKTVAAGGFLAFECGDGQGQEICNIFKPKTVSQKIIFDFNNIDRIVTFRI